MVSTNCLFNIIFQNRTCIGGNAGFYNVVLPFILLKVLLIICLRISQHDYQRGPLILCFCNHLVPSHDGREGVSFSR